MIIFAKCKRVVKDKLIKLGRGGKFIVEMIFKGIAYRYGCKIYYKKDKMEVLKDNRKIILSLDQRVYLGDIITLFDKYFDSVVPVEVGGLKLVDFSTIKEHTLSDSGVAFFFSSLVEGEWPMKGYLAEYSPKEGDVVFDCGAYCGVSTYFFSKLVGKTGKVYAFEPDDMNYEVLLKNIEKHKLTNVIPVKKGVYSKRDKMPFNNEGSLGGSLTKYVQRGSAEGVPVKIIEVISLEDAFKDFGLSHLDYVKMDIEGAEIDAIEGAREFLKNKNVHFAIASYHDVNGKQSYIYLEKIFAEIGYAVKTGNPEHLTTWANKKS